MFHGLSSKPEDGLDLTDEQWEILEPRLQVVGDDQVVLLVPVR